MLQGPSCLQGGSLALPAMQEPSLSPPPPSVLLAVLGFTQILLEPVYRAFALLAARGHIRPQLKPTYPALALPALLEPTRVLVGLVCVMPVLQIRGPGPAELEYALPMWGSTTWIPAAICEPITHSIRELS